MKTLKLIILTILTIGCSKQSELPKKSNIVAKYIVFNNQISSKTIKNLDSISELKNSNEIISPFKLDKEFYDLEYAFILNPEGTLEKLHEYKYSEYNLYPKYKIVLDTVNRKNIGIGFKIKLNEEQNQIIDGKDTIEILDIYPTEKLIRVDKPENKGRVTFYQYK
ncbi:hypothetical protein [Flavobacterium sp.]|jgi:hypothetical protein|uniref:hypothetical protein n=1 Tax=Flavobacterium sp. TaxID=239 RepID=UPI0037851286